MTAAAQPENTRQIVAWVEDMPAQLQILLGAPAYRQAADRACAAVLGRARREGQGTMAAAIACAHEPTVRGTVAAFVFIAAGVELVAMAAAAEAFRRERAGA